MNDKTLGEQVGQRVSDFYDGLVRVRYAIDADRAGGLLELLAAAYGAELARLSVQHSDQEVDWPYCAACQSWHHPDDQSCRRMR